RRPYFLVSLFILRRPLRSTLFPYTTLFRSYGWEAHEILGQVTHTLLDTRFPQSREAVDNILVHEGHWEGELTHTCRDGRQVIVRSEEHTSELQSPDQLVCRLLLAKKTISTD